MKKTFKPGERFNAAKKGKHKKSYSESDMGSMKGYDPTGGLGNKGYTAARQPKSVIPKSPMPKPVKVMGKLPPQKLAKKMKKHKKVVKNDHDADDKKTKKHSKSAMKKCKTCGR